jgi:putative DNA primase/helicase
MSEDIGRKPNVVQAAIDKISRLLALTRQDGIDRSKECLGIAEEAGLKADEVRAQCERAGALFICREIQPVVEEGPEPEECEPEEEPEPEFEGEPEEEAEPADEETIIEDTDAAEDLRRKLWRISDCLSVLKDGAEVRPKVLSVLRWMSRASPDAGVQIWVGWLKQHGVSDAEARRLWSEGSEVRTGVEELYQIAQAQGWRYPVTQNLNRLWEMVERTEAALVRAGVEIYQMSGKLVRPVIAEVDATKGRKTKVAVLVVIERDYLKNELSRWINFGRWVKGDRAGIEPPNQVIGVILDGYGRWTFPTVTGVICAPTLRRDGSVLAVEGFDPATGLIVMGPLPEMPAVGEKPSKADAERAIRLLDGLFREFPFVDEASRAVALSGLLSGVCRAALSCVPMHTETAPAAGTGKSFLNDVIAGVLIGDIMPVIATGKDLEELAKRLDAKVIEGFTLLAIDNVTIPLGGDELCQVIERPLYTPRVLGQSKTRERRNNWMLFADGNNLRLKDDVTRRSLQARLDAGMERPELRKFRGNPFETVLKNRGTYLWAALTVVKAYMAAGKPGRLSRIGDPFAEWSDLVRSALVWLGYDDPVLTMEAVRDNDPNRQARVAMFQAMANAYGVGAVNKRTASQMINDAKTGVVVKPGKSRVQAMMVAPVGGEMEAENLKAAITQYTTERLDARYLGNKFNTDKSAIAGGLRLLSEYDSHTKVNAWYVEPIN